MNKKADFYNTTTSVSSTHLPHKDSGVLPPWGPQCDGRDEEGLQTVSATSWRKAQKTALFWMTLT